MSQPGSQHGSQPGSKHGSQHGSQHDAPPGSQHASQQQLAAPAPAAATGGASHHSRVASHHDEDHKRGSEEAMSGPGAHYHVFVVMEEVLDKLKLLHYEETFCRQLGFKSLSRHYFALPTNPGEQFYNFTSIAAWLLQMCGKQFELPQEYDDPNATISNILEEVRALGHHLDFPPSKLKQGCGDQCVWVLDRLADTALKAKNFSWKHPVYPQEEQDEETVIDDDAELHLNKVEEDIDEEDEADMEDEEHILGLEDLKKLTKADAELQGQKPEEIMESNTDANEWKLEVERVLPQLKVTIRADNKDWRVHTESMHQHQDGIKDSLKDTRSYLDRLHDEIARTLEKIASREKYINNQLEHHLSEFRTMQDQLAETKERYRQGSGGVTERTRTLAEVTEELERIKQDMEERGSSMTDGAPLVKIKQSIQKLKNECNQMDIRIGVVQHILLQAKLKEKHDQNRHIANPNDDDDYGDVLKGF